MGRYCIPLLLLCSTAAWSAPEKPDAERYVFLAVPGMTCGVCPITVRKALSGVADVEAVSVDYAHRLAAVRIDPARTSVRGLVQAATDAGYPPELVANLTARQLHWLQTSSSVRP